jgi:hypothetical protein
MEDLLEKYKEHPVVKLIHFPKELSRTEKLTQGKEITKREKNTIFDYQSND